LSSRTSAQREDPGPGRELSACGGPGSALGFAELVRDDTFLPQAMMFLRPDFLACTAILGLGCVLMRWRTGSLWPAVILHGGFVVVWQTWLGGVRL
jgi:membrane protease YdiL (CAAX protease family)